MKRTLSMVAATCGGRLAGADRTFAGVTIDSRKIAPDDLFVALKGERFDAHDFLGDVARAGAAGAIVARPWAPSAPAEGAPAQLSQVIVPDPLAALTALGRAWRAQFDIPVVGVAGSNGKTTVKEMTAAILGRAGACLSTRGNLNTQFGVPMTLLRLEAAHRSAVIEIGANRPGEVAMLAALARPNIGLITNAQAEHLEGFGDLDGVARSEGEMVASLPADGVAIINADDAYAGLWRQMSTARRTLTFGWDAPADFYASDIGQSIESGKPALRFVLHAQPADASHPVSLQLVGRHNVKNALAAAAAAFAAGATLTNIVEGLQSVSAVKGRLQLKRARGGAWLVDDTYNANPGSVRAALEMLGGLPGAKWLVLGDMAELGEFSRDSHVEAGELARKHGVTRLFASGQLSAHAAAAFGAGAEWFADVPELIQRLQAQLRPGTTVLIKGSRVSRMERVVEALAGETD